METLSWTAHPARLRKKATVIVLLFIFLIFFVVYEVTGSYLMVLLAALIFAGSLSTYFLPTKYEITGDKVRIKYTFTKIEKNMRDFRSYYPDKRGVLLSPFPRPSRLENFRGLYLKYHNNKAEVDAFIKRIFEAKEIDT